MSQKWQPEEFREEETKTTCPVCRGSGKKGIQKLNATFSVYSFQICLSCDGDGMVTASKAKSISGTRRILE